MQIKTDSSSIWDEYQRGLDYQNSMGFSTKLPECVDFVEGRQWPPTTKATQNLPRPVINQCDFMVDNKRSNILSQTIKMVYEPEELPQGEDNLNLQESAKDMSDMAQNTWNDIDQDAINESLVNDTLILGTGIIHYFYDNSFKGGTITKYQGKIQGELIDPLDFFIANPHLKATEIQKQPWIVIRTRENTDDLIETAKKHGENSQNIQPDESKDEKYDSAKKDMNEKRETTCLTKYYRKDGQVYWTKVTENAIIRKPVPLSPGGTPFTLYPIVVNVFKERRKSTFGRSLIEDIIPNQKALNWGIAMLLLAEQQTAWPKMLVKPQALQQPVTNEPGEILTDYTNTGVDGIKYMQPPNFSNLPMQLVDKIIDLSRLTTNTNDVLTGEQIGANMAASAIIALQNQAKKPVENFQQRLFRTIKSIGLIWQEFYKTYYNMDRPIQGKDEEGNDITKTFNGSNYANMGFGLSIQVGPASVFSESLQVTILDKLFDKGQINKYQYVSYLPSNTVPQELKQDFEQEEEQQKQDQSLITQLFTSLSPEELLELKNNPALLQQAMQGMGGMA